MLEEFLNLEKKVNILTQYCRELKEENKHLKEMLSKNESDMYSLIEEKDSLAKEKVELSHKIGEMITDNNRISNLIHTIDSAIEGYDVTDKVEQKIVVPVIEHKVEQKIVAPVIEHKVEQKIEPYVENIKSEKEHIEPENKTTITQATSVVHVKEDEDPFSKANDNDWDNDIENSNVELGDDELEDIELKDETENIASNSKESEIKNQEEKTDTVEEIADDYDFEIEDDDGYVFSDDDDEDSGFVFEEDK